MTATDLPLPDTLDIAPTPDVVPAPPAPGLTVTPPPVLELPPVLAPALAPDVVESVVGQGWWWNVTAIVVLPLVAAVGAVLSWGSLYEAAAAALGAHAPTPWGVNLAGAAFPLLVDALILGASARYVAGVKAARPVAGWRAAAHAGVAGTVLLNAAASPTLGAVPWHVTAPIVWSVLVELVARDVLGQLREVHAIRTDRIPARLWLTAPAESARISWRMARTGQVDATAARAVTERCAAARDQLTAALPGPRLWRVRRQITRRLWAGVLDPGTLAHLITAHPDPTALHHAVLRTIATGTTPPLPTLPAEGAATSPALDRSPAAPSDRPRESTPVPVVRRPGPAAVAARESGPTRTTTVATVPDPTPDPTPGPNSPAEPSPRESADLERILHAITAGDLPARITKAVIREYLACSNPHAGAVNRLYQQHPHDPNP